MTVPNPPAAPANELPPGFDRGPSMLHSLTIAIARGLGDGNHTSIETAALFVRAAQNLGFVAEPRATAVIVNDRATQREAVAGQKAYEKASDTAKRNPANYPAPGWEGAGHVVVYVPTYRLLIDPSLPQLRDRGIEAPPLIGSLISLTTADGTWQFTLKSLGITYYPVPEDVSWVGVYQQNYDIHADTSRALADALRQGIEPEAILWQ